MNFGQLILPSVTQSSRSKIEKLDLFLKTNPLHPKLSYLLNKMLKSFDKQIDAQIVKPIRLEILQKLFCKFDSDFNMVTGSKFQEEVYKMDASYSLVINIGKNKISVFFLTKCHSKSSHIAAIIKAITTFCYTFPADYDGLTIYICLSDNMRNLNMQKFDGCNGWNLDEFFQNFKKDSTAFNVGGVTIKSTNTIIVCRTEEIIK